MLLSASSFFPDGVSTEPILHVFDTQIFDNLRAPLKPEHKGVD